MKKILKVTNVRFIIIVSVIATLAVFTLIFERSNAEYNETLITAKDDINRLAKVISTNVELSFMSVDQTLQRAAERQYFNILFGRTLQSDMEHNLSLWINDSPHIDAMMFTDENGVVDILFKKGEKNFQVKPGLKFSIKEHFNRHKKGENIELLISPSKIPSTNRIFASRRIENIDGSFGGLVIAVIDGDYITNFLKTIERERSANVAIMLDNGDFLAGGDASTSIFKAVIGEFKRYTHGSVNITEKYVNDEFRVFSFENLNTLPISVLLTVNEKDIFAPWRKNRNSYILFAAIFSAFVGTVILFVSMLGKKIRESKEAEHVALLASQTKSDFLAKMSHELRTPLNAIIGFSDMLSNGYFGKVNVDQVERLHDINMCGNHLLELISDILDFSKGDAGKLTLKEEIVDVYGTVNKAVRILGQRAKNSGINVINNVPREVNSLFADGRKIKQILINLLSNSIKFTDSGGNITIDSYFDKDENMVITVSDTGCGISQKDIPRALEVFAQVHGEDVDEGTGLGLPLCQMFTEMHGGNFKLESKVGTGTTAYITIPSIRVRRPVFEEEMAAA
jgi:signal transduction histidine kinase